MNLRLRGLALLVSIAVFGSAAALAQPAIQPTVDITRIPAAAQPSPSFNVNDATEAYMAMMPPAAVERSNAYFEGGYWLILWDFLYASAVCLIVLNTRWSAAMRNRAQRITRFRWLQDALYWIQYLLLTTVLGFPLEYYEGFVREHQYGMATQTLMPWMGDEAKSLAIGLVMGAIAILVLFAIVRKCRQTWWIWGTVVAIVFVILGIAIGPVFIQPMFNKVNRLDDPKITGPILRMAHANGISTNDVYEIDASRQTTRMSANVSGIGNTMRITLNDNLLKRGSPEEIQAVMGHEMGHYVMNHIPKSVLFLSVVLVIFFAYLRWALTWTLARWGDRWGIHEITDPAVLPLVFLLGGLFFFVLTPVNNTEIRSQEKEADMFGLNAARQPDGFAQAAIHLGEYRKMRPGPLEEILFFDHPSGYNRIHSAMQWKSENLQLFDKQDCPPVQGGATPTAAAH
jgi:STE24 endopeptidase